MGFVARNRTSLQNLLKEKRDETRRSGMSVIQNL